MPTPSMSGYSCDIGRRKMIKKEEELKKIFMAILPSKVETGRRYANYHQCHARTKVVYPRDTVYLYCEKHNPSKR